MLRPRVHNGQSICLMCKSDDDMDHEADDDLNDLPLRIDEDAGLPSAMAWWVARVGLNGTRNKATQGTLSKMVAPGTIGAMLF